MIGPKTVTGSEELTSVTYADVLTGTEISTLKRRAQSYQAEEGSLWSESLYHPYSQYFGFQTALKVKSVCEELWDHGYFASMTGTPLTILDLGAGTLGASLGAWDFFKSKEIKISEVHAIDRDPKPCRWAAQHFKDFLPVRVQCHTQMPALENLDHTLILAIDVFNESQSDSIKPLISRLMSQMTETTVLILIEPASKSINQLFLRWRDELVSSLSPGRAHLLLPCTHSFACPAIKDREWCHEERDFFAPQKFWTVVQRLGFRRTSLVFSLMVWGGQPPRFKQHDARVVSRNLKSKGRCEKWLCAQGHRWKAGMVTRKKTSDNERFFEALRGTVIDCDSTGVKVPV